MKKDYKNYRDFNFVDGCMSLVYIAILILLGIILLSKIF